MFHRQLCCVFLIAIIVNVYADVFIPAWMDFYSNPTTAPEERAAGSELTTVGIVPLAGDKVEGGNGSVLPTLVDILSGGKISGNNSEADFKINETDGSVSFVGGKKHNETDFNGDAKPSSGSGAEVDTSGSNAETKADSSSLSINGTKTGSDVQHVHVCSTDLHNMTCQLTPVNVSGAENVASDGEKTSDNNAETSGNSNLSGSENQDGVIVAIDTDKENAESKSDDQNKKEKDSSSSSSEEEKDKKHAKKNDHHHKNR